VNRRGFIVCAAAAPIVAFAGRSSETQWYPNNKEVSIAIIKNPERSWIRDEYVNIYAKDGWKIILDDNGDQIKMDNVKNLYYLMTK